MCIKLQLEKNAAVSKWMESIVVEWNAASEMRLRPHLSNCILGMSLLFITRMKGRKEIFCQTTTAISDRELQ